MKLLELLDRYSGILSAYGLALADVVQETQEPCAKVYCGEGSCCVHQFLLTE